MIEVECSKCGLKFLRTVKQVNAVVRRSGAWSCKKCSNTACNLARARPVGSTRISSKGYVFEKTDAGWVQQHRLVMEEKLGRRLLSSELVHHIDEDKTNNEPNNLEVELWGEHSVHHHTGSKRAGSALENIRAGIAARSTTRLNTDLVAAIKKMVKEGRTQISIAKEMNVSPMTISRAVRGESFKNGISK